MESGVSAVGPLLVRDSSRPSKSRHRLDFQWLADLARAPPWQNRDKTPSVEPTWVAFERKADSQVVENLESGSKPKEVLETAALRPRQVRYLKILRRDAEK